MTTIFADENKICIYQMNEELEKQFRKKFQANRERFKKIGNNATNDDIDFFRAIIPPESEIDRFDRKKVEEIQVFRNFFNIDNTLSEVICITGNSWNVTLFGEYDFSHLSEGILIIHIHSRSLKPYAVQINKNGEILINRLIPGSFVPSVTNFFGYFDEHGIFNMTLYAKNKTNASKSVQSAKKSREILPK